MRKQSVLASLAMVLCLAASCTIDFDGNPAPNDQLYLDQMDASIIISRTVGATTADVTATITDNQDRPFTMTGGQAVKVNDVDLTGPDANDKYSATVDASDQYEITVVEPSRGVEKTTVDAPAEFQITSPADGGTVSLSGFTLKWSGANDRLQVKIRLSQTYEGTETRYFGPYTDTGSRAFTADDLEPFVHGGTLMLNIVVIKMNTTSEIRGFNAGTASIRTQATRVAKPGP
jgi:hypothetical protein